MKSQNIHLFRIQVGPINIKKDPSSEGPLVEFRGGQIDVRRPAEDRHSAIRTSLWYGMVS